jgi:hypothetical protein
MVDAVPLALIRASLEIRGTLASADPPNRGWKLIETRAQAS